MISKTSRAKRDDCYVYITLPGQIESVVAGRYRLERDRHGNSIGRFVYGKSYLTRPDAVEIDPVELKLIPGNFTTGRLDGVFGALRDSGPDYWGRRLIEKYCGKSTLREIYYLLNSPEDRAGALSFGLNQEPPAPTRRFNRTIDLAKLQST
ncbi:MAG: HipA N-terminal domain-containing protein, partial [Cyanobacteria bacterium HKST-UBA01]|nr:HipA N-terminal domain-containing protein [Cyanobacteria bacterium HKST-UBA01]